MLTHAIIDALLGAAALGDIGQHFPDTDERTRAPTRSRCCGRRSSCWARPASPSSTSTRPLILEQPKLAPVRDADPRDARAARWDCATAHVNVKATRGEGMGFVGRGEGIAAFAIATVDEL